MKIEYYNRSNDYHAISNGEVFYFNFRWKWLYLSSLNDLFNRYDKDFFIFNKKINEIDVLLAGIPELVTNIINYD